MRRQKEGQQIDGEHGIVEIVYKKQETKSIFRYIRHQPSDAGRCALKMADTRKLWEMFKNGVYKVCLSAVTLREIDDCHISHRRVVKKPEISGMIECTKEKGLSQ